MRETIILGNHPDLWHLLFPAWHLLRKSETTLVAGEFFKVFSQIVPVIPIDLAASGKEYDYRKLPVVEQAILRFLAKFRELPPTPANPIRPMLQTLAEGQNLLIFPAGASPDPNGNERPWKDGIGLLLALALKQRPNQEIRFMHIPSFQGYQLSQSFSAKNFLVTKNNRPDYASTVAKLRRQYEEVYPASTYASSHLRKRTTDN